MIFESSSDTLKTAKGWSYNSTLGEWVDYENVISYDKSYKDKYKSLQGEYMMSNTYQNFLNIQTKTIIYKDTLFYVLIIEKWSGAYKYPSIKQDWYTFKEVVAYIFKKEEYQKIFNVDNILELKTKNFVRMRLIYENYDEIKFLDLIQTELSTVKSKYSSDYTFPLMKSKEGTIRFYIPDYFSTYSKYDFEKKYFETDIKNFNKIVLN